MPPGGAPRHHRGRRRAAGVLLDCMADYLWNYPRVMVIFWFVFAILLSGIKLARRAAQRGETGGARL